MTSGAAGPRLTGSVETTDGWPVGQAVLTVTDLTGQQVAIAQASADGHFAADGLDPGAYTAIVSAPGFLPAARAVMVGATGGTMGVVSLTRQQARVDFPEPGTWTIDPVHSSILITVRHLGLSGVRGRFNEFSGKITIGDPIETSFVEATIQADSVDTGTKMRDDHLRSPDFLDVGKFPTISYRSTGLKPVDADTWTVEGELGLCESKRSVPLELTYLGVGPDPWGQTRAAFRATARLKRQDYGIRWAQSFGANIAIVGSTLQVQLDLEAVQGDEVIME
jgi:polyisoprenoid-binding protein YceI